MRHVPYDPGKITYPDGWHDRAHAALAKVAAATPGKGRSDAVNSFNNIWSELKPELRKVWHDKCWYTEAPQFGTDVDVDHFRPKNSVKGARHPISGENHSGYWWRAFDPSNFRFSCIIANRRRRDVVTGSVGGKADEFPLWDENCRAWTDCDDCGQEQPLLIDPCNPAQVALVIFGPNCEAIPRYGESDRPRFHEMAKRSIELYHLNHDEFVRERMRIRGKIERNVEAAQRFFKKLDPGNADIDEAYMRAIEELREARHEKAPFSGFAVDILDAYRGDESLACVFR